VVHQALRMGRKMKLVGRIVWTIACVALCSACAVPRACAVDLIGYLPYYRMDGSYVSNTLPGQIAMLDEVRYFGLTVDNSGAVVPLSGSGNFNMHLNNIATVQAIINALPESQRPRLDITLGGAGEAASFATVSASSTLRATLAQNVDNLLDQTGATSVDIDWEHPSAGIERSTYYPALLSRLKQEVGSERRVYATVAPSVIINNSVFSGPNAVDGVSLMTYDLGWWGNDPGNPNDGEHSLPEYAVDAVNAWTEAPGSHNDRPYVFGTWGNNAPEEMLGVGMPFYGRSISGGGAYTYSELYSGGTTSDGNYYSYSGQTVWTLDAELAAQRVQFAHDRGLQNIIIWELAQDLAPTNTDSLLRAAFLMKQSLEPVLYGDYNNNGIVDAADYAVWRDAIEAGVTSLMNDPTSGVDESDYTYWRDHFGETLGGGGGASAAQVVPEPSALCSVLAALIALTAVGRRRGKLLLSAY
jgi:GH18 family chitinase